MTQRMRAPRRGSVLTGIGFAILFGLLDASAGHAITAIPRNADWKYLAGPGGPGFGWRDIDFDDTSWPAGQGWLGYGEPGITTTVPYGPDPDNKWITTYFRRTFIVDEVATISNFSTSVNFDDGFVLYLNGEEILRREMPPGPIDSTTLASSHEGGGYEIYDLYAAIPLLQSGGNVVAIEVHQTNSGSTDLVFDLDLSYEQAPLPPSAGVTAVARNSVWKYLAGPDDLGTGWPDAGFDDSLWPGGPGALGYGDAFIATVVPFGPDPQDKWRTTYFRHAFSLSADPSQIAALMTSVNFDDGFVLYLNGQEILRRGLPPGPIDYTALASSHEGGAYETFNLQAAIAVLVPGNNVLAAEVHQTNPGSSDLAFDLDLVYDTEVLVTRGPYLQKGTPQSVAIRWRTGVPTSSRVRLGPAPGILSTFVEDTTATTEHELELTGLNPATRYYYSVGSTTAVLAGDDLSHAFVTAPPSASAVPVRIWTFGDSGFPGSPQQNVRDAYAAYTGTRGTDVWLMLGDNAYPSGTDEEYQSALFDAYTAMLGTTVLWSTRGNHDLFYGSPGNDYYDLFTFPTAGEAGGVASGTEAYYSFDHANVHFVCLDSEGSIRDVDGPMAVWLRSDLAASQADWTVAFWHHPPYSKGTHDSDNEGDSGGRMGEMRRNFLPILDSAGVDVVLSGHSHNYERSFLIKGHYGTSNILDETMKVDDGDGRIGGNGWYQKSTAGPVPFSGAVYAVAGTASDAGGGAMNHPVMVSSMSLFGSLVIDVHGNRLDGRFLDSAGAVRDSFTILKGGTVSTEPPVATTISHASLQLRAANPSTREVRLEYALPREGKVRLEVFSADGRRVAGLVEGFQTAGRHSAVWDGRDGSGRRAPAGVYYAAMRGGGELRVQRIVRLR